MFASTDGTRFYTDEYCNTTTRILEKIGKNLHKTPNHPLNILKNKVEAAFPGFNVYDDLLPVGMCSILRRCVPKGGDGQGWVPMEHPRVQSASKVAIYEANVIHLLNHVPHVDYWIFSH